MSPATDWVELPFADAIRYLRNLRPTPKAIFDEMSVEARAEAFTASRVYKMEVLQQMLDQVQDFVEEGGTIEQFVERFADEGLTEGHLETVVRTNVQSAYGRGSWDQLTDPDLAGAIWGWRYHTVGDERVRDEHAALDGMEFELGAHDEIYPPWDFNCRCSAGVVTRSEAEADGLVSSPLPDEVHNAIQATQFASPALGVPYRPDLGGYDVGLISEFVKDQEKQ